MNTTKLKCSLDDTSELRQLILENPELPLIVFCGEESYIGEYYYNMACVGKTEIDELTLYGELWLGRDDYKEKLTEDLCDEEAYVDLSDEEYDQMIKEKVEKTEFVKAIVVYVG